MIVLLFSSVPIFVIFRNLRWSRRVDVEGDHTRNFSFNTLSLFGFQFLLLVGFVVTLLLQVATPVLGNDRAFSSMIQIQVLLESLHSTVSIYIMEMFRSYMIEKRELRRRKRLQSPNQRAHDHMTITRAPSPSEQKRADQAAEVQENPDLLFINGPGVGLVKEEAIRKGPSVHSKPPSTKSATVRSPSGIIRDAATALVSAIKGRQRKSYTSQTPILDKPFDHPHLDDVQEEVGSADLELSTIPDHIHQKERENANIEKIRGAIAKTSQIDRPALSSNPFDNIFDVDTPTVDRKHKQQPATSNQKDVPGKGDAGPSEEPPRPSKMEPSKPSINPFDFADNDTPTVRKV